MPLVREADIDFSCPRCPTEPYPDGSSVYFTNSNDTTVMEIDFLESRPGSPRLYLVGAATVNGSRLSGKRFPPHWLQQRKPHGQRRILRVRRAFLPDRIWDFATAPPLIYQEVRLNQGPVWLRSGSPFQGPLLLVNRSRRRVESVRIAVDALVADRRWRIGVTQLPVAIEVESAIQPPQVFDRARLRQQLREWDEDSATVFFSLVEASGEGGVHWQDSHSKTPEDPRWYQPTLAGKARYGLSLIRQVLVDFLPK